MSGIEQEIEEEQFIDESDDEDSDVEKEDDLEAQAEEDKPAVLETPKRGRGRPKGIKAGPRPTAWSCAGLVNGKVVQDSFTAPDGASDEKKQNFSEEEARAAFQLKYKVEAVIPAQGPFYDKKGGSVGLQNPRKKEVILALPTEYEVCTRRPVCAVFHGWRGFVHDIKVLNPDEFKIKHGVQAEDCCSFWPVEEVVTEGKKKNRPSISLILLTALEPATQTVTLQTK